MAVSVANQQLFPEGVEELGIAEPGGGQRGQGVCAVVVKRGEVMAAGEVLCLYPDPRNKILLL